MDVNEECEAYVEMVLDGSGVVHAVREFPGQYGEPGMTYCRRPYTRKDNKNHESKKERQRRLFLLGNGYLEIEHVKGRHLSCIACTIFSEEEPERPGRRY